MISISIPADTVLIGSPECHLDDLAHRQQYPRTWFEDEAPQHLVRVDGFSIDAHLVTNADFLTFTQETGHVTDSERQGFGLVYGESYWEEVEGTCWHHPGGSWDTIEDRMDHPVVHVSYSDASAYATWAGKRLPTEAEWEYAAHGPEWSCWPWGDTWDPESANSAEYRSGQAISDPRAWRVWWEEYWSSTRGRPGTTPVGAFSPKGDSAFGLADMAGNVSEWTESTYELYDPHRSYLSDYHMAAGRYKVMRGGSWMSFRYQVRASERFAAEPSYSNASIGFRCVSSVGSVI